MEGPLADRLQAAAAEQGVGSSPVSHSRARHLAPVTHSDVSARSDGQQPTATDMLLTEKTEQNVIMHYSVGVRLRLGRRGRWFESSRPDHFTRVHSGHIGNRLFRR